MANGFPNGTNGGSRRNWLTPLVIFLILFLSAGAYMELRPRRIRISVVKPVVQDLSSAITTNGKVEPVHGFEAHAPLGLTVQKVLVKEGDHVKAGQLLLVLDDARARSDLSTAQTHLKLAQERYANLLAGGNSEQRLLRKTDLDKVKTELDSAQRQLSALERLQQRGAASVDEVNAARDRVSRDRADLAQIQTTVRYSSEEQTRVQGEIADARMSVQLAEEVLRQCDVRAPFDGTVYFLPARTGAYVGIGELLLQEADLSRLQIRAFVDEPEIGRLALGQPVRITWDALPGQVWNGTIASLPSTVINRGSRVVGEVLCNVENSNVALLPNVNVSATITSVSRQNALTVPREAVREEASHNYVYVLQDHRLRRHDVKLGISNLTRVEILSGITQNDVIGVQSFSPSPLADGVEVKIVENPS
jgi:HlyD family secretion protein